MEENNNLVEAGKIYAILCHAKDKFEAIQDKKMALDCDRAKNSLCDIMKGMKSETDKSNTKIIVSSNIYIKGRLKLERKRVIFTLYKEEEYECEIYAIFDYPLSDVDTDMLIGWLSRCAKEDPVKVIAYLEEHR